LTLRSFEQGQEISKRAVGKVEAERRQLAAISDDTVHGLDLDVRRLVGQFEKRVNDD
jgi:hypothetical protein